MTATIRSRITELQALVAGDELEQQEGVAIGRAREAASKLEAATARLEGVISSVSELRAADAELVGVPSAGIAVAALREARAATSEDSLYPGRGDLPAAVQVLRSHADQLQDAVDQAWAAVKADHRAPTIDDELLGLAADQDPGVGHRVETARTHLMILEAKARPDRGDVDSLVRVVSELRGLAMQVAEQAPSESVIAFVRAASSHNGATVDQLTDPHVAAWLADGDRARRYVVRARGTR